MKTIASHLVNSAVATGSTFVFAMYGFQIDEALVLVAFVFAFACAVAPYVQRRLA